MGREFGAEWIHVQAWLSPFIVHLKPPQHCLFISYTPTQSKTFEEKRNGATTSPQEKNRVSCKEGMNVAVCSYGRDQRVAKNLLMFLLVRALIPS